MRNIKKLTNNWLQFSQVNCHARQHTFPPKTIALKLIVIRSRIGKTRNLMSAAPLNHRVTGTFHQSPLTTHCVLTSIANYLCTEIKSKRLKFIKVEFSDRLLALLLLLLRLLNILPEGFSTFDIVLLAYNSIRWRNHFIHFTTAHNVVVLKASSRQASNLHAQEFARL